MKNITKIFAAPIFLALALTCALPPAFSAMTVHTKVSQYAASGIGKITGLPVNAASQSLGNGSIATLELGTPAALVPAPPAAAAPAGTPVPALQPAEPLHSASRETQTAPSTLPPAKKSLLGRFAARVGAMVRNAGSGKALEQASESGRKLFDQQGALNRDNVETRTAPWPVVTNEMIAALREIADNPNNHVLRTEEFFRDLKRILNNPSLDHDGIVQAIYGGLSSEQINAAYGTKDVKVKIEVPEATLSIRPYLRDDGLRQALAASIRAIVDDDLKLKWMIFLMRDPAGWVRNEAAVNYTTLSRDRDVFAQRFAKDPDIFIRMAVARGLPAVSARLRWELIKQFAAEDISSDARTYAGRAITSFFKDGDPQAQDQIAMLKAWAEDANSNRTIRWWLSNYDPDSRKRPWLGRTQHDQFVFEITREIMSLGNRALQQKWISSMSALAAGDSQQKTLGQDVLKEIQNGWPELKKDQWSPESVSNFERSLAAPAD